MTSVAETTAGERYDARTVLWSGAKLGAVTAVGVVLFSLLSRVLSGVPEFIIQSLLVLVGGAVFSYLPAAWVQPRSADGVGWTSLVGLMGALVFTVIDTVLLRPIGIYHWTWDAIGGGSGFWYIPVWWMGSATLAWFGAMVLMYRARSEPEPTWPQLAVTTLVLSLIIFLIGALSGIWPWHASTVALAWAIGLLLHIPVAARLYRQ